MEGKIILANRPGRRYAVATDGGCTTFELIGSDELKVGDVISGNLESLLEEKLRHGIDALCVIVQNVHCGLGTALRWVHPATAIEARKSALQEASSLGSDTRGSAALR